MPSSKNSNTTPSTRNKASEFQPEMNFPQTVYASPNFFPSEVNFDRNFDRTPSPQNNPSEFRPEMNFPPPLYASPNFSDVRPIPYIPSNPFPHDTEHGKHENSHKKKVNKKISFVPLIALAVLAACISFALLGFLLYVKFFR